MRRRTAWWRYLLLFAVMAFIFVQSSFPDTISSAESAPMANFVARLLGISVSTASWIVRKAAHLSEYLLLGICIFVPVRDLCAGKRSSGLVPAFFISWFFGTVYAITDEFHQTLVPGRSGELRDVLIDSAGIFGGVLFSLLFELIFFPDSGKKE